MIEEFLGLSCINESNMNTPSTMETSMVLETQDLGNLATNPPVVSGLVFGKREIRRCSDPGRAQQLWDAIGAVRGQKQIPAITRMSRYMNRFYQINKEETQRLLDAAVEDNLIKLERKIGTKGHKSGIEEKAYRLPTTDMLPRERHDWYCFHCHSGGEVLLCAGCHRVYHENCLKPESQNIIKLKREYDDEEEDEDDRQEWFCGSCQVTQKIADGFNKKERKDLNHLLKLICVKMKSKLPGPMLARDPPQPANKSVFDSNERNSHQMQNKSVIQQTSPGGSSINSSIGSETQSQSSSQLSSGPKEEPWRANFLLKQQLNLNEMEHKCNSNQYRILEEFRVDAQLIVHNIVIFHGVHSNLADIARQMLRDCNTDLKDLNQCRDCFRYANEYREKYWFCKPCRPFHELVFAKQKGFPYWPAKVINTNNKDGYYEVRFFGGYHQKALVEKQHVKPISVNIHTLQVKRTSLWNKACEELRKHQELLTKCQQNETFLQEPYGDPFSGSSEMRSHFNFGQLSSNPANNAINTKDTDSENEEDEVEMKRNQILSAEAERVKVNLDTLQVGGDGLNPGKKPRKGSKGKSKKIKKEESEDLVSSSSQQEVRFVSAGVQTPSKFLKKNETTNPKDSKSNEELKQMMEKMRAEFDQEKKRAVNVATRSLERDLERLKADHATEIEEILESHKQELSENKKKQWCFFCEAEAIYHCCWNTAYCSIECQQQHWHKEHKRNCRRKR